jgi:hypothetical protein
MFRAAEEEDEELARREEREEEAEEERDEERGERKVKRTVKRTLRDAYRVLDDEMQLGFDFARWLGGGRRRRGRAGGGGDLLGVAGAGFRALGQLMELWIDLLGPLLPPAPRRLGPGAASRRRRLERYEDELEGEEEELEEEEYEGEPREERRSRHMAAAELTVSLDVRSKKPVLVSLEVDRDLEPGVLKVTPLRARPSAHAGKLPDITETSAEVVDCDHVKVHLRVPDDQPDGKYEASLLAGAGRVRIGLLRVEVHSQ